MKVIRKWSRILHRDIGFFFIGASLIYGLSGIALNHLRDWNPNYVVDRVAVETAISLEKSPQIKNNILKFLDEVNDSAFGLQAGVFTRDLYHMLQAWDRLEVGGVLIGDVPSWRVDNMPYGGVKESGLGREGVRFAMEDMTEIRNLVIRTP